MKSKKKLYIHLFAVVASEGSLPLHDLLGKISDTNIDKRVRDIGYKIRVEDEILAPSPSYPYWLIDFAKLRFEGGPGRGSVKVPTRSFDLDEDEGFVEETAMLYDPKSGFALIQYNHFGPRVTAISDYLSVFDYAGDSSYEFVVKLRGDAQARLDRKTIFTRIEMKVAPVNLTEGFKAKNVALSSMLKTQTDSFGGDFVSIEISLERNNQVSLKVKDWLRSIKLLANEDRDAVKHLLIAGRDGEYESIEPINLLAEKEELSFSGVEMDSGHRYIRKERYARLEGAFKQWKSKQAIP